MKLFNRQRHRGIRTLLICVLCLLALFAAQPKAMAAGGASLVVDVGYTEYGLSADRVLVDLYYVGSITAGGYRASAPFGDGILTWSNNEEAAEVANTMAGIAFDRATPVVSGRQSGTRIERNDENALLPSGLYLVVLRGSGLSSYVQQIRMEGKLRYVTIAVAPGYQFRFLPTLVVLKADEDTLRMSPKADLLPLTPPPTPTPRPTPTPTPTETPTPTDEPPGPGPTDEPPPSDEPTPTEDPTEFDDLDENGTPTTMFPTDTLPQTGQLWWPVPVLAGLGLILILAGVVVCVKNRRKKSKP